MPGEALTTDAVRARYAERLPASEGAPVRWHLFGRGHVGVLLAEIDRLCALLESGAEQVHGMGRELAALRRQLADAHAALREYREDEG